MNKLIIPTLRTCLLGIIVFAVLLVLPAWTLNYWQAWVLIAVIVGSANAIGVYLAIRDPELLERRKHVGPAAESRMAQKIIISFMIIGLIALLVFSAFDHRFAWSPPVPSYVSLAGDLLVALGFLIDFLVLKENSYGASTIQIVEDQRVIATGPYALVRHPMYAGVLVMLIGIPLALGSWWGLAGLALITPLLIWRLLDEENLLKTALPGYIDYVHGVRYRLVPYVW
jgi:protein-S-isoprenylcysteine O-methyltransferase Ste14